MTEQTELAARMRAAGEREEKLASIQFGLAEAYRAAGYEQEAQTSETRARAHQDRAKLAAQQAENTMPFVHELAQALRALLDSYQELHDSGDAGNVLPDGSPVRVQAISALDRVGY